MIQTSEIDVGGIDAFMRGRSSQTDWRNAPRGDQSRCNINSYLIAGPASAVHFYGYRCGLRTSDANASFIDCRGPSGALHLQRCHGASWWNGRPDTHDRCDLAAWPGNGFDGVTHRHPPWRHGT